MNTSRFGDREHTRPGNEMLGPQSFHVCKYAVLCSNTVRDSRDMVGNFPGKQCQRNISREVVLGEHRDEEMAAVSVVSADQPP